MISCIEVERNLSWVFNCQEHESLEFRNIVTIKHDLFENDVVITVSQ